MISYSELAQKLKKEKSVAMVCHVRPDGDTLGSALALSFGLKSLGITSAVFCDDDIPSRFFFLKGMEDIKRLPDGEYSALVAIDCATDQRIGDAYQNFVSHKNTYVIDHHISNTRFAMTNFIIDNASNSENVFDLLNEMGVEITTEIANYLLMGIMTDTGNFRHKNVTPKTLYTAAVLKEKGGDINLIYYHTFSKQSKSRAKLFGIVMSKIRYFHDDRLAVATVRLSDIENAGAKANETEGFIDFLMGIESVEVGICILETNADKYKISFRSKSVDVNAVAQTFGGGGHVLASGCQIFGDYEEVVDRLQFAVNRELPL